MYPRKIEFITLGLLALLCSKIFFWLINDPGGANLLIVLMVAAFLFLASLFAYHFTRLAHTQQWIVAALVQILLVIILYRVAFFDKREQTVYNQSTGAWSGVSIQGSL